MTEDDDTKAPGLDPAYLVDATVVAAQGRALDAAGLRPCYGCKHMTPGYARDTPRHRVLCRACRP